MKRISWGTIVGTVALIQGLALGAPSSAFAQETESEASEVGAEPEASDETPSKINLYVPPPAPVLLRRDYYHEGLYVRVSAGAGATFVGARDGGFAGGFDALVGGSPAPGISIGGAALTNGGTDGFQFLVGPFFDAFPNPRNGGHIGAAVGLNGLVGLPGQVDPAFGAGGSLFAGYDFWVAPNWSAGFLLRGGGGFVSAGGAVVGTGALIGSITLLYN